MSKDTEYVTEKRIVFHHQQINHRGEEVPEEKKKPRSRPRSRCAADEELCKHLWDQSHDGGVCNQPSHDGLE